MRVMFAQVKRVSSLPRIYIRTVLEPHNILLFVIYVNR